MPPHAEAEMIPDRQAMALRAAGRIETIRHDVASLQAALDKASLWRPATGLQSQCSRALEIIDALAERLDYKLVVTLIGPCGSGKSTLLNALAGVDELSRTGIERPTTRELVVLSRDPDDAGQLRQRLGGGEVVLRSSPAAAALEHVILIDTPDTDSTEQQRHLLLLQQAITLSDILICVFNAENPKTRDHADVLAPYVALFDGQSLVAVLNRCDRLDENELHDVILPEFRHYLADAWPRPVEQVLCLSARSHLRRPDWDPKAPPRHAFDQFEDLRELVFGAYNRPGFAADRRVRNAGALRDFIFQQVREQIVAIGPQLEDARRHMQTVHREALGVALETLASRQSGLPAGTSALLYQQLSQRWSGPVGWLVAAWSRLLNFGGSLGQMLRPGHLVGRLLRPSGSDEQRLPETDGAEPAFERYRLALLKRWPAVAEILVEAGFDPSVRQTGTLVKQGERVGQDLARRWNTALAAEVERSARLMSGGAVQLVFNLPVLAVLAYTGWLTVSGFFNGHYLNAGFFLHAAVATVVVLFLSFFLLQGALRLLARPERALKKTLETARQQLTALSPVAPDPLEKQVAILLDQVLPLAGAVHRQAGRNSEKNNEENHVSQP
jgi:energy-coupling factor transporter ATP-binding protein EcfA2